MAGLITVQRMSRSIGTSMGYGMFSEADKSLSAPSVFIAGIAWRLFGSRRAGATLLRAMTASDEQNRMLAGMSLVKAGERSLHLIENTITNNKGSVPLAGGVVPLIRLLPDIGGEDARELLQAIASRESGDTADAATECIDLLDRMNAL